jgi:hypothetical protein
VWVNAELAPIGLGEIDNVIACGLFEVLERQRAVGVGDFGNLIEAGDGISHMCSVSQWLFASASDGERIRLCRP